MAKRTIGLVACAVLVGAAPVSGQQPAGPAEAPAPRDAARQRRQDVLRKALAAVRDELAQDREELDRLTRRVGSKDVAVLAIIDDFEQTKLQELVTRHAALQDDLAAARDNLKAAQVYAAVARRPAVALTGAALEGAARAELDRIEIEAGRNAARVWECRNRMADRNRLALELEALKGDIALKEELADALFKELVRMVVKANVPPR